MRHGSQISSSTQSAQRGIGRGQRAIRLLPPQRTPSLPVRQGAPLLSSFSVGQEGAGRNKRSALRRAFTRILRGTTRPCPSDHLPTGATGNILRSGHPWCALLPATSPGTYSVKMSAHAPRDASLQMQVFNMDLAAEIERNVSQALAEDMGTGDLTASLHSAWPGRERNGDQP